MPQRSRYTLAERTAAPNNCSQRLNDAATMSWRFYFWSAVRITAATALHLQSQQNNEPKWLL